jgi:ribosomal protein S10
MAITQTITALPPPPDRLDPATFDSKADAFVAALPNLGTELNTYAGQVNATVLNCVAKAGDTMEGPLVLPGDATTALQAIPKQQLDAAISGVTSGYVAKAGDTMEGPLVLPGDATTALQAIPKQQLDAAISGVTSGYVAKAGDTMEGPLVLPGDATTALQAIPKQQLDTAISGVNILSINAQTGTTYTLSLTDTSKLITLSNAAAITVTVPANASVAFSIGAQINLVQAGAGKVTFSPAAGVTINSKAGNKSISQQWVGVSLIKTDTDVWLLLGDLIA